MPTCAASGGVPAPAASSTASNRAGPVEVCTVAPRGPSSSANTTAGTRAAPARATSSARTASTSITPPDGSSSTSAGGTRAGSPAALPSMILCGAPTAAMAAARSATSSPLSTQPAVETSGPPARSCQLRKPASAVSASRTSSGSAWASRKMRDEPAERSVIAAPARSKQVTSAPRSSSPATADSPTTPAPTTATRTRPTLRTGAGSRRDERTRYSISRKPQLCSSRELGAPGRATLTGAILGSSCADCTGVSLATTTDPVGGIDLPSTLSSAALGSAPGPPPDSPCTPGAGATR